MATPPELGSRWSAEGRVLFRPASTYDELASGESGRAPVFRRPLFLAFVLGCAAAGTGSGRFSLDLIADGMVSFAFVPAGELAAFAILYWISRRRSRAGVDPLPFGRAVDAFFIGNAPWLIWVIVLLAATVGVAPRNSMSLFFPAVYASLVPMTWAAFLDFQFFRRVLARTAAAAVVDLILYRAIAWSLILGYFIGIALVTEFAWVTR